MLSHICSGRFFRAILAVVGKTKTPEQHATLHAQIAGKVVYARTFTFYFMRTTPGTHRCVPSGFFDKLRLELHRADAVDLAVDIVIAVNQADVFYLGADLDDRR